ncbi:malto-oligosyltrehalose trehalohydrolase [Arsenicitalea aurantiaca]|uniref:Malto-oligosyltrehalose trehalohydrolase n=2 Tax=Arsenicitalea aurantiaca TaxID=1783274 RepID=A0A433XM91_9HYPH|nr:malto-oligosyltrehalose trehalohydrolase [Arsenicitalea aurantiaca]
MWGAMMVGPERVRFRLWAPGENALKVRIEDVEHPMTRKADGWFEAIVDGVPTGARYLYVLDDGSSVPDPAARAQAGDVHGPSIVVDPHAYRWRATGWTARPWEETVHYELHIGTFTPEGTFEAAIEKLDHLADLGITTIEIMPVGQFEGRHGWGYDGVLIYAPHRPYGTPEAMKALIDAAHERGMNVVLDVIYNHFGPEGNYLSAYAPDFFHPERHTPWGNAIAYEKRPVREFFIENALYWLEEFRLDGLRLDAVDHIHDEASDPELLVEIGQRIRAAYPDRAIHLTTEDNRNVTHYHERGERGEVVLFSGEWNDDFHNVAHAIATGETEGYYVDFVENHWWQIARSLAEGFAYQGEPSRLRDGEPRGFPSGHLPPTAFVDFIQNHDQVGNRAFGERLIDLADRNMVETLLAMLLLSPHIPLLFMGEEWGETRPFAFFTDFKGELADAVREGRRREFASFAAFHGDAENLEHVPDPNAQGTFEASRLNWDCLDTEAGQRWMALTKRLIKLRHERIVPHLYAVGPNSGTVEQAEDGLVSVSWRLTGAVLHMVANLDDEPRRAKTVLAGEVVYATSDEVLKGLQERGDLPARTIVVTIGGEHQDLVTL